MKCNDCQTYGRTESQYTRNYKTHVTLFDLYSQYTVNGEHVTTAFLHNIELSTAVIINKFVIINDWK